MSLPKKATEKATEEGFKIARDFLDRIGPPGTTEFGGILGDQVKYWRAKRMVDLVLKMKAFLESKGVEPQRVLPTTLFPALEAASLEPDDELQAKWAAMLAHAADPASERRVTPAYPRILEQLTHLEVRLLDWLYQSGLEKVDIMPSTRFLAWFREVTEAFPELNDQVYFSIVSSNLDRLGLVEGGRYYATKTGGSTPSWIYDRIDLTPIGVDFICACSYGQDAPGGAAQ